MLKLYQYEIPLIKPIKLKGGILSVKRGLICESKDTFADISPLPNFSLESIADIIKLLPLFTKLVEGKLSEFDSITAQKLCKISPALSFGYYQLTNIITCQKRLTPYKFVLGSPLEVYQKISSAHGTYKIKVGLYDINEELNLLTKLSLNPNLTLILDANRTLSYKDAKVYSKACRNLLYFEDPCDNFADAINLDVAIAIDELKPTTFTKSKKVTKPYAIIHKPTIKGLITTPSNVILSSSFESIVGITYLEKLAYQHKLPAVGTDTLKFFKPEYNLLPFLLKKLTAIDYF